MRMSAIGHRLTEPAGPNGTSAVRPVSPGDPALVIAGDSADAATIQRIHAALGLDKPLLWQFFIWLRHILSGDLGTSIFSNLPVTELIMQRAEPTVSLALATRAPIAVTAQA